jgi:hypothetical protein
MDSEQSMQTVEDNDEDFFDSGIDTRLTSSSTKQPTLKTKKVPANTNIGDRKERQLKETLPHANEEDPKKYKLGDFNVPVKFAFTTDLAEYEFIEKGTLKRAVFENDPNHKYFEIVSKFFDTLHLKLPKPGHCKYIRDVQTELTDEAIATFGDGNFATHVKFVLHKLLPVVYCKNKSNTTYSLLDFLYVFNVLC